MPRNKERIRKKLGLNNEDVNLNQANKACNDRNGRKSEHSFLDSGDSGMNLDISSVFEKLQNYNKLNENYDFNLELINLEQKISELVNQRDVLLKHDRNLTGLDEKVCSKNINAEFLVSEICDLKSMVRMLQNGLNFISDEHSVIKGVVINKLKDIDNLLERNLNEGIQKSKYHCLENQDKYLSSRFRENSGFLLPKYLNSNQRLFDHCKTSSISNHSISHLFTTVSKVNAFKDSLENDSIAKFRQLAELKIIIEIMQKYSKIVTNEFKKLKSTEEVDQNPFEVETKINRKTGKEDQRLISLIGTILENNEKSCHGYQTYPDVNHEVNNFNKSLEVPIPEDNQNMNQIKMPSSLNILNHKESGKSMNRLLFSNDPKYQKPVFEEENSWNMKNDKEKVSSPMIALELDEKLSERKVLFLSDCHGRNCSQFLQDELGPDFSVISVLKPDALFLEIVEDFKHLASYFSRDDYVVIFAGANDLKCNDKSISNIQIELIVPMFKHTNLVFTRIPLLFDQPSLNSQIRRVNSENCRKVHELAKKYSNILFMPKYTFFSRDQPKPTFNKAGKRSICKLLAKTIMTDSFKKRQKQCVEYQHIKINKPSPIHVDATVSQLLNFADGMKLSTDKITGESTKNEEDAFENIQQMNKSSQQLSKREENHNECSVDATISQLLNFADKELTASNVNGESTINNGDSFVSMHHVHGSNQQLIENAQTQSIQVNRGECPCLYRMANDQVLSFNPNVLSEVKSTSKTTNLTNYYVEQTNFNNPSTTIDEHFMVGQTNFKNQSTTTDEHFMVGQRVEDNYNDCNLQDHQMQGYFAGIFMKNNQTNMTTMKELLGQGDIPKHRKNFIQENVRRLKELKLEKTNKLGSQRNKNLQPLVSKRNAGTMVSSSRLSGHPSSHESPSLPHGRRNKQVTLSTQRTIADVDESPRGYRSQGCQTLSSKQLEHLYEEGVIRFPSVRGGGGETRRVREMALQTETPVEMEVLHPPPPPLPPPQDNGLHWDEEKGEDKDYVKLNATVPDPRRHKTPEVSSTDPTRAPPTYQRGVVPKYLKEHKKELERERMNKAKEEDCPEGHIQLPDDIKQKHLTTLKQKYEELVSQLNQLPVSTDTLRTRTRKKQIEADLDRIEAAIALFSREKVFVKADS